MTTLDLKRDDFDFDEEDKSRMRYGVAMACLWVLSVTVLAAGCASRGATPAPSIGLEAMPRAAVSPAALPEPPPPLDSREYKLLLRRDRFADRAGGAQDFWDLVEQTADDLQIEVESAEPDEKRRRVWFLDTRDFAQRLGHGLVFRERLGLKKSGKAKKSKTVTLKYRGPDQTLAAALDLSASEGEEGKQKLEEDVVFSGPPALVRKLSKSGSTKLPRTRGFATAGDIADLFPEAGEIVADIRQDFVAVVNHFFAQEIKRDAGTIELDDHCEAEASFSFWYDWDEEGPLEVAEFSFGYEIEPDCTEAEIDSEAQRLLIALGRSGWPDPEPRTKTQVAYDRGDGE